MRPFPLVLKAGLLAGTLDIIAAILVYGYIISHAPALRILQTVASGVYGSKAFAGGWAMAIQGLLFHYLIAIAWAGVFLLLWQLLPGIRRNWVLTGIGFGVLVWAVMNLLVLPVSGAMPTVLTVKGVLVSMLIVVLCVGLPVAAVFGR
ncbi:hypothetical protein MKQ68_13335 [Chitinophaga horti]|uniref:DUF1440 domain-containing protein n=1 Tax=Chitinophaga horti TaxID=2920382 RepID=A0ABY6IY48_9BACT|nr:hypothetical protein [Chitinophaga horti]UYQ91076.1 hypothetical protein MKQ68_13335 [Chitinophaga horti]